MIRNPVLEAEVAKLYSDALPYHGFHHVQDVLAAGETILERCREEGIRVDESVVYLGILLHDAGFHEDHEALGFSSKEAYSAHLANGILPRFGYDARVVRKVCDAIMATHRDGTFITAEQKAVRAADLSGLAADFETFLTNTRRLKDEAELLFGRRFSWDQWVTQVKDIMRVYLGQEIRLTSYFSNEAGESAFHAAVRANIRDLLRHQEQPANS